MFSGKCLMNRGEGIFFGRGNSRNKYFGVGLSMECELFSLVGVFGCDELGVVFLFVKLSLVLYTGWCLCGLLFWVVSSGGIFLLFWIEKKFSYLLIVMWLFKEKIIRDVDFWFFKRREGRKKFFLGGRGRVGNI